MQARYYDPVIGRFYSNDPIGFRDVHSFNRYAYANNNPYKYIDPDGKQSAIPNSSTMQNLAHMAKNKNQVIKSIVTKSANDAIEGFKSLSGAADLGTLAAISLGQAQIAGPLAGLSAASSITANTLSQKLESSVDTNTSINNATIAEGAGEFTGKAAENFVHIAGEVAGSFGVKGKVVEKIIDISSEYVGQKVSDTVKEEVLRN